MSDRRTARGPVAAVLAALAALLVAVAGCSGDTGPNEPSPGPSAGHDHDHELPGAPDPTTAGPDVVAAQALSMMFTWQPVTDPSSGAGLRRAAPWLGGDLAAAASSTLLTDTPERSDPRWAAWRRSGDVITATADVDAGHIPDTPTTAVRLVTVRQKTLHADGATTPLTPMRIEATCSRTDSGWRLTGFTVTAG